MMSLLRSGSVAGALLACGLAALPAAAQHHGDVEFGVSDGALVVEPSDEGLYVFEGEFGENPLLPANVADEPGFESEDGSFIPGDEVRFDLMASLLFWDGAAFAAVPNDHHVEIHKAIFSRIVDESSGPQTGFVFGVADGLGEVHEHLDFVLHGPGEPGGLTPGAYGLWMRLNSTSYDPSNEFIVLLNYGLGEEEFEAGVEAAGALVPEPTAAALLLIPAFAILARRRS